MILMIPPSASRRARNPLTAHPALDPPTVNPDDSRFRESVARSTPSDPRPNGFRLRVDGKQIECDNPKSEAIFTSSPREEHRHRIKSRIFMALVPLHGFRISPAPRYLHPTSTPILCSEHFNPTWWNAPSASPRLTRSSTCV